MISTPVKGNGDLYMVTDAVEYDERTGGWFSRQFPETYSLQKAMPPGRAHPDFQALKDFALALGKISDGETWLRARIRKTLEARTAVHRRELATNTLRKRLSERCSQNVDESGQL